MSETQPVKVKQFSLTKFCKKCGNPVGLRHGIPRVFCSATCNTEYRKTAFRIPPRKTEAELYSTTRPEGYTL